MKRIVVIKRDYQPIIIHPQGYGYFIQWDYKPSYEKDINGNSIEAEHGTCLQIFAPYRKPTINLIKYLITNFYNNDVNQQIYEGFKWNGYTVYLTNENQFNYKAMYDIAIQTNGSNLPVTIKVGDNKDIYASNYITFNTIDEFKNFYMSMINYIQKCTTEGWKNKDSVDYDVFEEALSHIIELPEDLDILTNTL